MTRWSADVSPDNAWPEYPRPQMVRDAWLNLNGLWQFAHAKAGEKPPLGKTLDRTILVPYPVESALSGVMEPAQRVWYRRTFQLPEAWRDKRVLLHFGAVDWEATVWINGRQIGSHRGGYDGFSFDVTDALRPTGPQEIVVGVFDPTDEGTQPYGKQTLRPRGIWYTPTTGIWQTVWLEPVPAAHIAGLKIVPDVDGSRLRLTVDVSAAARQPKHRVRATVLTQGQQVARAEGAAEETIDIALERPRLWSPDDPFLYDLRVELQDGSNTVDRVDSYFGMRKIEVRPDDGGARLLLNGRELFQIGPLDQGFWPDGLYTAPTDEALRYDVETTRRLGFNMSRKHVKVEPARWYYWCDRLGLLVWQDMPSVRKVPEDKQQFETELRRLIEGRGNHPSIVMWVVFNEGWGQYDTARLTKWVKGLDPSRLVCGASGWHDRGVGDVIDMHKYPGPGANPPEPKRANVLGEFGGLGLPVPDHAWPRKTWSYQGMADGEQLTLGYMALLYETHRLRQSHALQAAVYTQLTDVEVEINGLLTYDRAVLKVDAARVAAANRGEFPPQRVLLPDSEQQEQTWRYTMRKPGSRWFEPDYDDSKWKRGHGGFGTAGTPGAVVRTRWRTDDIWLRRDFRLSETALPETPMLRIHHDDSVEVYLNGVLAAKGRGYKTGYVLMPLLPEARGALRPGNNTIAVHCHQSRGGQYIDVGLVDWTPRRAE